MAAYAALVSPMNDLELVINHPRHSFSFDTQQISSLSQTVHFLIGFMERNHSQGTNREFLERQITSAAHTAHDLIESHIVDQIHAGKTLDGKARSYFLLDLQKAIDRIGFVKRKAMQAIARGGFEAEQTAYSRPLSSESLNSRKNTVVGFESVTVRLMEMLTGDPSSLKVMSIVGMGGIGKTTLAKQAYHRFTADHHFDVCLWVTISQQYSLGTILTELLGERESASVNVDEYGLRLHKKLWGRRYLIILDDMWSSEAWDGIQMFFPDNENGSRVIVTTRLSNLASCLSSSSPIEMEFLEENKSWELFCEKAFGGGDCPPELEEIGKKIVKRCHGLPLSIVVVGGHLQKSSRTIEYWEKIANLMNPVLSSGEDEQCYKILSLSYHHLPVPLKPCFLYLGIFPEDRCFSASELVQLWVAEGFLKPNKELTLEEVAEEYLSDLIDRNLILVLTRSWNGKAELCFIHDTVRELCLKVASREKFLCVLDDIKHGECLRRVAIPEGKHDSDNVGALKSAPLIRSVYSHGKSLSFDLRLLRLTRHEYSGCFPAPNFQQVNLRYLASHYNSPYDPISYLPWSISLLWNLQTLIIKGHYGKMIAPSDIWEMPQLRHLDIDGLCLPEPLPNEKSHHQEAIILENLQTLSRVRNLKLTEEVCKRMPNIKHMNLTYLPLYGHSKVLSDYCTHNLCRFNKLESLSCYFRLNYNILTIRFPSSIRELYLNGLGWDDLKVIMKWLPHLTVLELGKMRGPEWDLVEDELEFCCLKTLIIYDCEDLIYWNADSSHFPALEFLEFSRVPKLEEIPLDIAEIATLGRIRLVCCKVDVAISAMRIAMEQESLGIDDLRLDLQLAETEDVGIFHQMVQEQGLRSNNLHIH